MWRATFWLDLSPNGLYTISGTGQPGGGAAKAKGFEPMRVRERVLRGERLVGTFVKTTHYQTVEILTRTELDFIVLDAEHAPFDRAALDASLLAAQAGAMPALVRVPDARPETILSVLDMGAAGIIVPHLLSAESARQIVKVAHYRGGARGFSNSHRAGNYGRRDLDAYMEEADAATLIIGQIEDREAVDAIDDILTVEGIDCLFLGRADLMVSLGAASLDDPRVNDAVARVARAARAISKRLGIFLANSSQVAAFSSEGISLFVIGTDQSLLKGAVAGLLKTVSST